MKFMPHEYQQRMIRKVVSTPRVGLFLDMGLGLQDGDHTDGDP